MEWLEGEDLGTRLCRMPLSARESVIVAQRTARALGVLHAKGIVHRDVKPANVFLVEGAPDAAKLLDLGIARYGDDRDRLTRTGSAMGTPGFMAPEQARGGTELTPAADVFALGCLLYECLTGQPTFSGDHAIAILARVLLEPAPVPSDTMPGLPPELDAIVLRLLEKDPKSRPQNGAEVESLLAGLLDLDAVTSAPTLAMPMSMRGITESEQRVVSVVLVGGADAARAASGDTSEVDLGIERLRAAGARLESVADGSLLLLFTGEGAATDRAADAARAALRLREMLPRAPIALATGTVLVRASRAGGSPMGDAVDRAARALAGAQGITVDDVTAQLLDARFDVKAGASGARELVGENRMADGTRTRTLLGKPTPCVGRERELAILTAVMDECEGDAVARGALVTGPPGIGKSRVLHEFLRRAEQRASPPSVLFARGDPVGRGSPFGLVARAVKGACGVFDGEPPATQQQKLAARVGRRHRGEQATRLTHFLGELVGAPFPDEASVALRSARTDPMLMGDEMRRAFEDFLAGECAERPVLLVLEDLHWGDRPTVSWIDAALRNLKDHAFMALALARPEVFELFPRLWGDRSVTEVRLGELSRKASERLVRDVLGADVPPALAERVVVQAGGNAFYLEELIRAAASGGGADSELPGTVLAMVHARLDALDASARLTLRAASVFGQIFWKGGVEALLSGLGAGAETDTWIELLTEREVIERRAASRFPDHEEYAFRHALVREAAYSMLPDDDRSAGHKLAGKWLEASGESSALTLAEHFELGGAAERAAQQYLRAADQALEGNDLEAVVQRVEKGILVGASGAVLGGLRMREAVARKWRGEFGAGEAAAEEAMELLAKGSGEWCMAAAEALVAAARLGNVARLITTVEQIRSFGLEHGARTPYAIALTRAFVALRQAGKAALADELRGEVERVAASSSGEDPLLDAQVAVLSAVHALTTGDAAAGAVHCEAAMEGFLRAGDRRNACQFKSNVAYAESELGNYARAEALLREVIVDAERMGVSQMTAIARKNLGYAIGRQGRLAEAKTVLDEAVKTLTRQANTRPERGARIYLAEVLAAMGDLGGAERELGVVASTPNPPAVSAHLAATRARLRLTQGDVQGGLEAALEAMAILEPLGAIEEGESGLRLVVAQAHARAGNVEQARAAIASAERRLLERAEKIADPRRREAFLESVEENRETRALARALLRSGES
jgi:eukaryotic-like serine/threonine-protein kinase